MPIVRSKTNHSQTKKPFAALEKAASCTVRKVLGEGKHSRVVEVVFDGCTYPVAMKLFKNNVLAADKLQERFYAEVDILHEVQQKQAVGITDYCDHKVFEPGTKVTSDYMGFITKRLVRGMRSSPLVSGQK